MLALKATITKTAAVVTSGIVAAALLAGTAQAHSRYDRADRVQRATGKVVITVVKRTQRMTVRLNGKRRYVFRVSTGKRGHATPRGRFKPLWLTKMHYSKKYNMAKMPNSIFFTRRGHAIHGTNAVRRLGRPASHGCIRLAPGHARLLFALVKRYGRKNVTIRIV